jgi:hypothetical protein
MLRAGDRASQSTKPDPCLALLDQYTACVAEHTKGLSEGDDCSKEGKAYKDCRKQEKLKQKEESEKK